MAKARKPSRTQYHHGNLREALIEAAVQLMNEGGPEHISVREAAKRVGVSASAPFRHFANRTALITAVAEEATSRLLAEITKAVGKAPADDPLARFAAIGAAYLSWVIQNPTHFQVVSTRSLIDWESSVSLREDNEKIRALMEGAMVEAQRRGLLRSNDLAHIQVAARALVYGLGRMYIDGHFAQWAIAGQKVEPTMLAAFDLTMGLLTKHE